MPIMFWRQIVTMGMFKSKLLPGHIAYLMSNGHRDAYFSEPSGMAAFIFEAEADEHPPPPVPAIVALLGSILSTEATALSICEGMLEKDLKVLLAVENSMRGVGATLFLMK